IQMVSMQGKKIGLPWWFIFRIPRHSKTDGLAGRTLKPSFEIEPLPVQNAPSMGLSFLPWLIFYQIPKAFGHVGGFAYLF
ncbi:MAG: hypothetical protein EAY75_03855, partial [Bacteroidetes bacterium]